MGIPRSGNGPANFHSYRDATPLDERFALLPETRTKLKLTIERWSLQVLLIGEGVPKDPTAYGPHAYRQTKPGEPKPARWTDTVLESQTAIPGTSIHVVEWTTTVRKETLWLDLTVHLHLTQIIMFNKADIGKANGLAEEIVEDWKDSGLQSYSPVAVFVGHGTGRLGSPPFGMRDASGNLMKSSDWEAFGSVFGPMSTIVYACNGRQAGVENNAWKSDGFVPFGPKPTGDEEKRMTKEELELRKMSEVKTFLKESAMGTSLGPDGVRRNYGLNEYNNDVVEGKLSGFDRESGTVKNAAPVRPPNPRREGR